MCLQTCSLFLCRYSGRFIRITMIICIFIPLSLTGMESRTEGDHILHTFLEVRCLLRLAGIFRPFVVRQSVTCKDTGSQGVYSLIRKRKTAVRIVTEHKIGTDFPSASYVNLSESSHTEICHKRGTKPIISRILHRIILSRIISSTKVKQISERKAFASQERTFERTI